MTSHILKKSSVVQNQLKKDIPKFAVGSFVEVYYKIKEDKNKERTQLFKGLVTNIHEKTSLNASFTVLKISVGSIKVERTFPLHSPFIEKIVVNTVEENGKTMYNRARRANIRENMMNDQKKLEPRVRKMKIKSTTKV